MKTFQQFITKKIYDAAKLVGGKTIQCNIEELSTILGQARQVTGGKKWTFSKTAIKELANPINAMYIKRRFLNHWAIFKMVETNIVMAAGESRTKVVRKTWSRRHVGDKA